MREIDGLIACVNSSVGYCYLAEPSDIKKTPKGVFFMNVAVSERFELSIRCRIHTFQACSFSHSDNSPNCC
ncbi:hypothetical protein VIBNIAM115_650081 [Vibrio nigripulchritudo AM115]|nr:hypothetical protein VIBNIAM115_650081 [Vibrio nigripulchritudo AM115]